MFAASSRRIAGDSFLTACFEVFLNFGRIQGGQGHNFRRKNGSFFSKNCLEIMSLHFIRVLSLELV